MDIVPTQVYEDSTSTREISESALQNKVQVKVKYS